VRDLSGILYLVPTPIGNLGDITLRALETLKSVHLIASEDTRKTGVLLKHFEVKSKQISYHKFNERSRVDKILSVLSEGLDVAIVTDAGSPGISDPAQIIVQAAIEGGFTVTALPGATALIPALTASGLATDSFVFHGFLPTKRNLRDKVLKEISTTQHTSVLYESGNKLLQCLRELLEVCGDRQVVVAREISKLFEEYIRGTISELLDRSFVMKGEFVLLISGATSQAESIDDLYMVIDTMLQDGQSKDQIIEYMVQNHALTRNVVYKYLIENKRKNS
jgi:16S rRNA (cytidine1402-2'-O)-methyltransferase